MDTTLISSPPVVLTSWIEATAVFTFGTLVGISTTAYKHIECHSDGCHRLGRFPHGHLKLCHVHHPKVPDDGKIGNDRIQEVTCSASS